MTRDRNSSQPETKLRANKPETLGDSDGDQFPSTSVLAMRGRRHDLALTAEMADRITPGPERAGSAATADDGPRWTHDPSIQMMPNGAAGRVIRDPAATVSIAQDGSVRISDAADMSVRLNVPSLSKLRRRIARDLTTWIEDPYRDAKVGRVQELPVHLRAVPGACDSFGSLNCVTPVEENKMRQVEGDQLASTVLISGQADITGYLQRKFVSDPFAARKLKILDQTRDDRVRLGAQFRSDQSRRSAELMQRNLDALSLAISDPADRRVAVLALFDECEDDETGRRARAMVIGWIRAHLAAAFTTQELAELERRAGP